MVDMLADANVAQREWDGQDAPTKPVFENVKALAHLLDSTCPFL
jgi:hypothetical protein